MPKRISTYLNLYIPRLLTHKYGRAYIVGVCTYIVLSLSFHHPFGGYISDRSQHYYILSCFGSIFALVFLLFYIVLPRVFKQYFDNSGWNLTKELSVLLLFYAVCSIANWLCVSYALSPPSDLITRLICILLFSFTFNLVPVIVIILIQAIVYLVEKYEIIRQHPTAEPITVFRCANGKEILLTDILFFYQSGNYQYIHYVSEANIVEEKERRSMKTLLEMMAAYPQFKSCHASYLVNTDKIECSVTECGEKKLKLIGYDKKLNVSYKHRHDFDQYLLNNRK